MRAATSSIFASRQPRYEAIFEFGSSEIPLSENATDSQMRIKATI
ncbi:MAG: hypothetical protein ACK5HO_08470 [Pseudomonadota bacterium]